MKYSNFRPKGTSDEEVLADILKKANQLLTERSKVLSRHAKEIEEYKNVNAIFDDLTQFEKVIAERLLEVGGPEEFNFEFHEFRRGILIKFDSDDPPKLQDLFADIVSNTSIKPLLLTLLDCDTSLPLIYSCSVNPKDAPKFELEIFCSLEIEFAILQIYSKFVEKFGERNLLSLMKGEASSPD